MLLDIFMVEEKDIEAMLLDIEAMLRDIEAMLLDIEAMLWIISFKGYLSPAQFELSFSWSWAKVDQY